ncbi:MAG: DNA-directed RNA polymerase subunit omega [Eubacteriales bacterium]|nr:DNA-directed RNA polymerase subunit omega [Eubacteriales bacterium]
MIHPSYSELIQAINTNSEEDDNTIMLNSRYSLVLATSKRARQIIGGAEPMVEGAAGKKPLSTAIDEFYKGKVKIIAKAPEEETASESAQAPSEADDAADAVMEETATTEEA